MNSNKCLLSSLASFSVADIAIAIAIQAIIRRHHIIINEKTISIWQHSLIKCVVRPRATSRDSKCIANQTKKRKNNWQQKHTVRCKKQENFTTFITRNDIRIDSIRKNKLNALNYIIRNSLNSQYSIGITPTKWLANTPTAVESIKLNQF